MDTSAIRRLTLMTVVTDVEAAARPLLALGATRAESGVEGCLGVRGGGTAAIFVTRDHLAIDFGHEAVELMAGRSILYAHVADAEAAAARFVGRRVASALTRGGTLEVVCMDDDHVVIFAEKVVG